MSQWFSDRPFFEGDTISKAMDRRAAHALIRLVWACVLCACEPGAERADLVLRGGAVYTAVPGASWSEAVAVRDGRIAFVGNDTDVTRWVGSRTEVIDLGGRALLPGFHDSHIHPVKGGIELGALDLTGAASRSDLLERIARYVREHPDAAWIEGRGWGLPLFPGAHPHRSLLDSIVPDRPAYLKAQDGHSAWVNSRALSAAGITRATPDPAGGTIERDTDGEPSGTLRETAMGLVEHVVPEPTPAEYVAALRHALRMAARFGVTGIQAVGVDEPRLAAYAQVERRGELTAYVTAALLVDTEVGTANPAAEVERLVALRRRYRGRLVSPVAAKLFVDGVIEAHTAALLEPYLDRPGERGDPIMPPERLNRLAVALASRGFQLHFHAIGDRAVRMALDATERAREASGASDQRHMVAHLQLIDPGDVGRFAGLGVVAVFQPLWAYRDRYITELTEPRLGPERSSRLYPIGSVVETGAVVAGGSDWPVSSMNPLRAMQVGVIRRRPESGSGPAWLPNETVYLPTMIAAYTRNGAYASHMDDETGTIEVGKSADMVVLDRNPFEVAPEALHEVRVLLTVFAGRVVYRDPRLENGAAAGQVRVSGAVAKW